MAHHSPPGQTESVISNTGCATTATLPVFQHAEGDVQSFRMFTSQMIAGGTVKPKEIGKTFGVPTITVKRYVKLYRDHRAKDIGERGVGLHNGQRNDRRGCRQRQDGRRRLRAGRRGLAVRRGGREKAEAGKG